MRFQRVADQLKLVKPETENGRKLKTMGFISSGKDNSENGELLNDSQFYFITTKNTDESSYHSKG